MPFHLPEEGTQFMCSAADMVKSGSSRNIDRNLRMEIEANQFAASILMPVPAFRLDLEKSAGPDLELIVRLAEKYNTSKEATARRFCDLIDTPSAIVISRNGEHKYWYRKDGSGFPFISVKHDADIPNETLSAQYSGAIGDTSGLESVDGHWWVDAEPYCNGQLYEQTHIQANGYRLTLLQLDDDEADDDGDLLESYTPRFRKR